MCGGRLAIAPLGDAVASGLARAVPTLRGVAVGQGPLVLESEAEADAGPVAELPPEREREAERDEAPLVLPRRVVAASASRHRASAEEVAAPPDAGADGGATLDSAPRGTIVVPAALVSRALERRDVGAVNAKAPDGSALGARLVGVTKYRTGLRDGDVVVSVSGTRTPNVASMAAAAMQAVSSGATRLSGRILRGDTLFAVVLELPR